MSQQSNSKRLAKNTILMYVRMVFLMLVNLYASRIILQQLGVDDFGIYNLVGSIVALFISLKAIFAASTQRFLNFEMGKGNERKLQLIFNLSTYINGGISIVFFLLAEVVGIWFLECHANIPSDRLIAAHWILQFSVFTTIIGIMNTPLDACVIAHERMDFYAYLSVFEGLAKLGICFLLSVGSFDKLIFYGALVLGVAIINRLINQWFCLRNFPECHIIKTWDKAYFKRMASYATWAFFGNTAFALAQSGLNMVLNVFGGSVVNAARGIAYQVNAALWNFIVNITIVLKPYTVKSYAAGEKAKAFDLAFMASKIYFFIQMLLVLFVVFLADYLIQFWLGQIPEYVVIFLDLVLIQSLVKSLQMPLDMLFSAEGNIKYYQLYEGIVLFLPVPAAYILLKMGLPYYSAFIVVIVFEVIHIFGIALIGKKVFGLNLPNYTKRVIFPCIANSILCLLGYYFSQLHFHPLYENILYMLLTMIVATLHMYLFMLNSNERTLIIKLIKKK